MSGASCRFQKSGIFHGRTKVRVRLACAEKPPGDSRYANPVVSVGPQIDIK